MPYTLKKDRRKQDPYIDKILWASTTQRGLQKIVDEYYDKPNSLIARLATSIKTTGDLNYTISRITWSLFYRHRRYAKAEELIGAIVDAQYDLSQDMAPDMIMSSALAQIFFSLVRHSEGISYVEGRYTLECAKLEFYVRHVRKYEDEKINIPENGDVNYEWPTRPKTQKKRINVRKVTPRRKRLGSS